MTAHTDPHQREVSFSIAAARLAAGLTQAQLGEKVGLPQNVISRWERGVCIPKSDSLFKIAKALGCSMESLMK